MATMTVEKQVEIDEIWKNYKADPTNKEYRNLLVEKSGAVTLLTVNRPGVMNALNRETLSEIEEAARAFVADPESRALIVTGAGDRSFVSGADINELATLGPAAAEQ